MLAAASSFILTKSEPKDESETTKNPAVRGSEPAGPEQRRGRKIGWKVTYPTFLVNSIFPENWHNRRRVSLFQAVGSRQWVVRPAAAYLPP